MIRLGYMIPDMLDLIKANDRYINELRLAVADRLLITRDYSIGVIKDYSRLIIRSIGHTGYNAYTYNVELLQSILDQAYKETPSIELLLLLSKIPSSGV